MFINKTAWFSESVRRHLCEWWVTEGGIITDWKKADYLFSEDASHSDTLRLHESRDYAEDRITIFHSSYLTACKETRSKESMAIGHFIFPPKIIQNEMRKKFGNFIWEKQEHVFMRKQKSKEKHLGMKAQNNKPSFSSENDHEKGSAKKGSENGQERHKLKNFKARMPPSCHPYQYPVNNMISDYVHVEQLKRYSGQLNDFKPGHAGYSVKRSE